MRDLLFWPLALVLVASALGVVLSRSLYRAAYCLAATLVTTAAFYFLLTAPLLAAVQLLLYPGGVLTLVVFALVMTEATGPERPWRRPIPAALLAGTVLAVLATHASRLPPAPTRGGLEGGRELGLALFSRYLVPFELLSVLLLGALFGALVIARREREP